LKEKNHPKGSRREDEFQLKQRDLERTVHTFHLLKVGNARAGPGGPLHKDQGRRWPLRKSITLAVQSMGTLHGREHMWQPPGGKFHPWSDGGKDME